MSIVPKQCVYKYTSASRGLRCYCTPLVHHWNKYLVLSRHCTDRPCIRKVVERFFRMFTTEPRQRELSLTIENVQLKIVGLCLQKNFLHHLIAMRTTSSYTEANMKCPTVVIDVGLLRLMFLMFSLFSCVFYGNCASTVSTMPENHLRE